MEDTVREKELDVAKTVVKVIKENENMLKDIVEKKKCSGTSVFVTNPLKKFDENRIILKLKQYFP